MFLEPTMVLATPALRARLRGLATQGDVTSDDPGKAGDDPHMAGDDPPRGGGETHKVGAETHKVGYETHDLDASFSRLLPLRPDVRASIVSP